MLRRDEGAIVHQDAFEYTGVLFGGGSALTKLNYDAIAASSFCRSIMFAPETSATARIAVLHGAESDAGKETERCLIQD